MAALQYKLCFYVPLDAAEAVKQAVFASGAGKQGNYARCCWQSLGQGQFQPMEGANPAIGVPGRLEQLDELKVEILCDARTIKAAVAALVEAHPYEEPAFDVLALTDTQQWLSRDE